MAERHLIVSVPADEDPSPDELRDLRLMVGDLFDARVTFRDSAAPALALRGPWADTPEEVGRALRARLERMFPGLPFAVVRDEGTHFSTSGSKHVT